MSALKSRTILHRQSNDALHIYDLKSNPSLAKHNTIARVWLCLLLFGDNLDIMNGNGKRIKETTTRPKR